ncbi:unnamed protein product [Caenorhabditis nigoni]
MSAEKVPIVMPPSVAKETPHKHQFPRTRHMSGGKMLTYRNGNLISVKKATAPTPFKKSQKKEHIEARKAAEAISATKKKGCRDLYQEISRADYNYNECHRAAFSTTVPNSCAL